MKNRSDYEPIGLSNNKYPQPLTLIWRINHTIAYLLGGITFLLGSIQYLPSYSNYVLGGWLFTIGSTGRNITTISSSFSLSFSSSFSLSLILSLSL